jgi:8-oxo-dGTP diphosphatase
MPTLGVNTIVLDSGEVLLIKRTDIPMWALPGGGVDENESLMDAAVRETEEETGLAVDIERLSGLYSRPNWRAGGDHVAAFVCRRLTGKLKRQSEETSDCRYHHVSNLPEDTWPPHREMIRDALKNGERISIRTSDDAWPFGNSAPWAQLVEAFHASGLGPAEFFRRQGWYD